MYTYLYPIIGAIGVTILAMAGSLLPPIIASRYPHIDVSRSLWFRASNGFAAGVVVTVAYVHSFSDAIGDLSQVTSFPWAGLIAMIGTVITFLVEEGVARFMGVDPHCVSSRDGEKKPVEWIPDTPGASPELCSPEEDEDKQKFRIEMYTLLFGLSFHSIFVGFTLGVDTDNLPLLVAVIAHQFFEGVALGMRIAQAKLERKLTIIIIDLIYTLMTPAGIGLGIIVSSFTAPNSKAFLVLSGISNGLSAGILIYVGLLHMMIEDLQRVKGDQKAQMVIYSGFILGSIFMSVVAIWA